MTDFELRPPTMTIPAPEPLVAPPLHHPEFPSYEGLGGGSTLSVTELFSPMGFDHGDTTSARARTRTNATPPAPPPAPASAARPHPTVRERVLSGAQGVLGDLRHPQRPSQTGPENAPAPPAAGSSAHVDDPSLGVTSISAPSVDLP
jgi:hypothetical protein